MTPRSKTAPTTPAPPTTTFDPDDPRIIDAVAFREEMLTEKLIPVRLSTGVIVGVLPQVFWPDLVDGDTVATFGPRCLGQPVYEALRADGYTWPMIQQLAARQTGVDSGN